MLYLWVVPGLRMNTAWGNKTRREPSDAEEPAVCSRNGAVVEKKHRPWGKVSLT